MNLLLKPYPKSFYARPTVEVARNLLGATLNRRLPTGSTLSATICEVEAYTADDPACHAYRGPTKRCSVMFGSAGIAYVYFIYGMYHCLNVVSERDGIAGAVLIRGLALEGMDGPGKICRQWQIDRSFNGASLLDPDSGLWISSAPASGRNKVQASSRIGISQAQDKLWRFKI